MTRCWLSLSERVASRLISPEASLLRIRGEVCAGKCFHAEHLRCFRRAIACLKCASKPLRGSFSDRVATRPQLCARGRHRSLLHLRGAALLAELRSCYGRSCPTPSITGHDGVVIIPLLFHCLLRPDESFTLRAGRVLFLRQTSDSQAFVALPWTRWNSSEEPDTMVEDDLVAFWLRKRAPRHALTKLLSYCAQCPVRSASSSHQVATRPQQCARGRHRLLAEINLSADTKACVDKAIKLWRAVSRALSFTS